LHRRFLSRLSYADVMSTVAVSPALGGGAVYAAGRIGAGDLKDEAIHSNHIKDGQVRAADLAPKATLAEKPQPAQANPLDPVWTGVSFDGISFRADEA
jgi:hypothetical protein